MEVVATAVNRSSSPALFRALEEMELSFTQVKALFTLERGELSVGEIGAALGLSLPATSRAVDGLAGRQAAIERFVDTLSESERGALHSALLPIAERIAPRDGSHPPL
jgi:DNA-binding MarR family transcriptional regulator